MEKYLRIDWSKYQKYQDREDFNDLFDVHESGEYAYILETDYETLVYSKYEYPVKVKTNTGAEITIWQHYADCQEHRFWRNYDEITKGSWVIFYSKEKGYWISKCTATTKGLPEIFEGNECPGINCEIIGVYDPEMPF